MNNRILLLFILLFVFLPFAQLSAQSVYGKVNATKIWLNAESGDSELGYLYLLGDTSLFLAKNPMVYASELTEYQVPDIYSLKARRRGSIGTGILLGAAAGFLANGVIDLLRRRPTQSACGVCPLLAELDAKRGPNRQRYISSILLGGTVGGLIGGIKVNISINGRKERYLYHKEELKRYLIH